MNADEFNARYPVGTLVFAYPGARPEDMPSARRLVTRTRSEASVLGGHTDVVWVADHSSCIALSHVDVVTQAEWAAARTAEDEAALTKKLEEAKDRRRRIYIDGKGNGWIDLSVDPETGERDLAGITDQWKVASAEEVRSDTGSLREIGRCW